MRARPALFLAGLLAATLTPSSAFAGGAAVSAATGERVDVVHKTILSFSAEGTTIVEQMQWSGDGGETLWLLPILPGAEVVSSSDALVSTLEEALEVVVRQPANSCFAAGFNECGGVSVGGGLGGGGGLQPPVTHTVLWPIDRLRVSDDTEVASWFADFGVTPPAELMDAVQAAELEGYELLLLRLPAGEGLRTSAALRISSDEASAGVVPMLSPRTDAEVSLTVIADRRYGPVGQPVATIEEKALDWSWDSSMSNYDALAGQAIAEGWLAEAAEPLSPYAFDRLIAFAESDPTASGYDADADAATAAQADVDALRLGLDAGSTWVTRLVTRVPASGFEVPLTLSPVDSPIAIDRDLVPANETGTIPNCELENGCGDGFIDEGMGDADGDFGCRASGRSTGVGWGLVLVLGLALRVRRRLLLSA